MKRWVSSSEWVPCMNLKQQAATIIVHKNICYKSHTDKLTTVLLYSEDDTKVKWLFYATVHSVMMGQWGLKHVGVDV
jgi:hypothetical protein